MTDGLHLGDLLSALLDGELAPGQAEGARAHAATCPMGASELAAVAGTVAAAVFIGGPSLATAGDDPIDQARKAAEATPFSGRVTITWNDGAVVREDQLDVESAGGVLSVKGTRSVMALAEERLVHGQAGWQVLWPSGLGPVGHPGMASGYAVRSVAGPVVAGHPTRVAEVRKGAVLRE